MTDQARIRLAEMMGWTDCGYINDELRGKPPNYNPDLYVYGPPQLPNPFTNANDCEAVIYWLNEQGWTVTITYYDDGICSVLIHIPYKTDAMPRKFDNWKTGVCELALEPPEE